MCSRTKQFEAGSQADFVFIRILQVSRFIDLRNAHGLRRFVAFVRQRFRLLRFFPASEERHQSPLPSERPANPPLYLRFLSQAEAPIRPPVRRSSFSMLR
ncbi:MAG: hypothetical protein CSA62_08835 [Planctomycetota bacterium]|nr:MAG: hypothetical protein CSA62_08835 [Planctomycetota bacterium]